MISFVLLGASRLCFDLATSDHCKLHHYSNSITCWCNPVCSVVQKILLVDNHLFSSGNSCCSGWLTSGLHGFCNGWIQVRAFCELEHIRNVPADSRDSDSAASNPIVDLQCGEMASADLSHALALEGKKGPETTPKLCVDRLPRTGEGSNGWPRICLELLRISQWYRAQFQTN